MLSQTTYVLTYIVFSWKRVYWVFILSRERHYLAVVLLNAYSKLNATGSLVQVGKCMVERLGNNRVLRQHEYMVTVCSGVRWGLGAAGCRWVQLGWCEALVIMVREGCGERRSV